MVRSVSKVCSPTNRWFMESISIRSNGKNNLPFVHKFFPIFSLSTRRYVHASLSVLSVSFSPSLSLSLYIYIYIYQVTAISLQKKVISLNPQKVPMETHVISQVKFILTSPAVYVTSIRIILVYYYYWFRH